MKEEFVTYEIALKLKELGFDEPCFGYFPPLKKELTIWYNSEITNNGEFILAPLWQQVIDFIWEKYHILINTYQISHKDIIWQVIYEFYPTKEQAILKAIELCKIITK